MHITIFYIYSPKKNFKDPPNSKVAKHPILSALGTVRDEETHYACVRACAVTAGDSRAISRSLSCWGSRLRFSRSTILAKGSSSWQFSGEGLPRVLGLVRSIRDPKSHFRGGNGDSGVVRDDDVWCDTPSYSPTP